MGKLEPLQSSTQTVSQLAQTCLQAITTSYRGPTDTRGARVSARCDAMPRGWSRAVGRITVAWDHAVGPQSNHAAAALSLMHRLGWPHPLVMGSVAGNGYVFVQVPRDQPTDGPSDLHELALSMEHHGKPEVRSYGAELRRRLDGGK